MKAAAVLTGLKVPPVVCRLYQNKEHLLAGTIKEFFRKCTSLAMKAAGAQGSYCDFYRVTKLQI